MTVDEDEDALPRIGAPATGALEVVGVTRLSQVREWRAGDLAALHGVGPKAITILRDALAERGWSFATDGAGAELRPEVQAYIDALEGPQRRLFDRLHALILDEVPEAEVAISYQIPLYKAGGRHVGLNARRADGVTLTATAPGHIAAFQAKHPEFTTNKASIQFGIDDELPEDDVREVIRRAIRE